LQNRKAKPAGVKVQEVVGAQEREHEQGQKQAKPGAVQVREQKQVSVQA
jgi:hypothetical protein